MHGAHGKPLQIAGKTQHLDLQWGEARRWACFIVIVGLESPPCLIGMDIMRPLRVHIDVTNGMATPAQPNPQTSMPPKSKSSEKKYRCLRLDCSLQRPLILRKFSHTGRKSRCWKLARQPREQPLRLRFRSNERKCRCRKLTPRPWGPLILPKSSCNEGKCRRLELGFQLPPSRRSLPRPPLCPSSFPLSLHCRLPHRAPPLLTPLAALGCYKQQTSLPRRLASFVATTRGLPRTSSSAPMTLSRPL